MMVISERKKKTKNDGCVIVNMSKLSIAVRTSFIDNKWNKKIYNYVYQLYCLLTCSYCLLINKKNDSPKASAKDDNLLFYDMQICTCDHFIHLDIFLIESSSFYIVLLLLNSTAIYWVFRLEWPRVPLLVVQPFYLLSRVSRIEDSVPLFHSKVHYWK